MFFLTANWILFCAVHSAQSQNSEPLKPNSGLYEGAQLWRANLRNADDILLIKRLMDNEDVSMWKLLPKQADFLVKPEKKLYINRQLKSRDLNHTVLIMDIQRRIEAQAIEPDQWDKHSLRRGHRMNWKKYPTLEIIYEYINFLSKSYPSICKEEIIGRTGEKNNITIIKISNGNPSNKAIILNAGSHAREWIAITSVLVILREIITKYDEQPSYIKDKDWYVIPLLNPDGFQYTHKTDRFWRKNRRRIKNCYGVDLNRNFNVTWLIKGISETSECMESYIGPHPFSEPESRTLRDTVLKKKSRLSAVLDFHAYGQMVLYPWSGKSTPTELKATHNVTASGLCQAIYKHSKKKYKYGHTYHVVYPASGSAMDWIYDTGIVHTYVIEGQDKGYYGFLMPPEQIEDAGMEMLAAVKYLANTLNDQKPGESKSKSWF